MQIRLAKARALKFEKEESGGLADKEDKIQEEKKVVSEKPENEKETTQPAENGTIEANVINEDDNKDTKKKKYADESDWLEDDDEEENESKAKEEEKKEEVGEVDLLDAYMKSIESKKKTLKKKKKQCFVFIEKSAKQEAFQLFHLKDQTFFQPVNKVHKEEHEIVEEVIHPSQLITYEEIMMKSIFYYKFIDINCFFINANSKQHFGEF